MTGKESDKICTWIQVAGLLGFVFLMLFSFFGKEDSFLERTAWFAMAAGVAAYVLALIVSSHLKSVGILFLLVGGICVGTNAYLALKGYGGGEAEDRGVYAFTADRYWQEEHTRRIRHRTTKTYTNYVEYKGVLDNGEEVTFKNTTSSIGDAMELVNRKVQKQRQVFFYNQKYYTDEPGTGEREFLSGFLAWKKFLYMAAGGYALLGGGFLWLGNRISWGEDENEAGAGNVD